VKVYRLHKEKHIDSLLTGYGASLAGGRWNAVGVSLVYTSMNISLATLEVLVHTRRVTRMQSLYLLCTMEVDDAQIMSQDPSTLGADWRANEASCVAWTHRWLMEKRSVGLRVPSAVTDGEENVILNPSHPAFPQAVSVQGKRPATFDERVLNPKRR
jgi:RES domain-containing protein